MGKSGGKGMPSNLDSFGMQNMMEMMEKVQKDPELIKQMDGYWKMLDNMQENDPNQYKKFIDEQKKEMEEYTKIEEKEKDKKNTI